MKTRDLKLGGVIVYTEFQKIGDFKYQQLEMTYKQIIYMYHSKGIDESCPKMYFLLNLSYYVKRFGHFSQNMAFFTMPTHQIWSCHVIQEANFENVLFSPISTFNIKKSHKISSRKALYFRSCQQK